MRRVWSYPPHVHVFPPDEDHDPYGSPCRETTADERRPYAEKLREVLAHLE